MEKQFFDNSDLVKKHIEHVRIGLWKSRFGAGEPEMYMDDMVYDLLGLDRALSPQELYKEWFDRVDDACKVEVATPLEKMKNGMAEVQYTWHHPDGRTLFLRTGGGKSAEDPFCVEGYLQNITSYNHLEFEHARRQSTITIEQEASKNARESESVLGALTELYDTLTRTKDCTDEVLAVVAKFYQADRAYVFQISVDGTWIANTLEWCAEGVTPEIDNLQKIPIEGVQAWVEAYETVGAFYISKLDEDIDHDSLTYKVLEPQNIDSLITAPIYENGELFGFVGVDNPRANTGDLMLLKAFAQLSSGDILKRVRGDQKTLMSALADAEKGSRAKSNFLFNMSHDIRTPMNAIIGYTAIARKHLDDRGLLDDYLKKIDTAGGTLLTIVNQVLEMSHIESDDLELREEPADLIEMTKSVRSVSEVEAKIHGLSLEFVTEDIRNRAVITDVGRIDQILTNIIGNAIKYTREGGHIRCVIRQEDCDCEGYGMYSFTVSDNGIGMSGEFLAHIYEQFARENTSTVSGVQGTGLGMTIVKRLVDRMEGTIDIASKLGEGTTVTIKLPLRFDTRENGKEEPVEETVLPFGFVGRRVLLVEDNEMNREIALEILEEQGFTVEQAEDGDIAVDLVCKSAVGYYDFVLMDIQMPRMDGYEATKQIRALENKDLADLPIIALSANAFEEDRRQSLAAGMNAHVAKPINLRELLITLGDVLKQREP